MCGIAGIFDKTNAHASPGIVEAMVNCLKHRGPDDQGIRKCVAGGEVIFGHTRLSILDLSQSGHQPMSGSETGVCLNYNGECYNYLDLRRELSVSDIEWRSDTDTEVVLRAYERWGHAAFKRLRGMFALALWDSNRQTLVLARDQFGIKPLYYYRTGKSFIFASELRALLASGLIPRRLGQAGLTSYLQTGSVASPDTIIEGVRLLSPGNYMTVEARKDGTLEVNEIPYVEDLFDGRLIESPVLDRREAVEALREALKESVRLHLASDVPLGLFLSGGMDSSAILAFMAQVTDERPKTFSVVFAEEKFSEALHSRRVTKKFGTEHHEIHLGEQQLFDMLPTAISAEDQPTMDGINTFIVSKAVKDVGITVALSGLGGDELFAGYPTFRRALRLQSLARFPNSLRKGISSFGERIWNNSVRQKKLWQLLSSDGSAAAVCQVSRQLFPVDEINSLLFKSSDFQRASFAKLDTLEDDIQEYDLVNAMSLYEMRGYMANTLLRDTDCMSMAHSLEVRVPFIDAEIVSCVMRLPGAWKLNGGRQKPLLQDVLGDMIPSEVMNRPKMGFTLPFEDWMQSRLRDEIETTFADESQFRSIGLQPEEVQGIWRQFLRAPQAVGWSRPWALYVLARWCSQHQVIL
jgi:asparagine synthase (glutamine-hydrolysing)